MDRGKFGCVDCGSSLDDGALPYMEDQLRVIEKAPHDSTFAAVYDGHGSDEFAIHARDNLHTVLFEHEQYHVGGAIEEALKDTFAKEDESLLYFTGGGIEGGCTATVCSVMEGRLHIAHVGDSRSLLVKKDGSYIRLTEDHHPDVEAERDRVKNAGGMIFAGRVQGVINVTRSLADHMFKFPFNKIVCDGDESIVADFVSGIPDTRTVELDGETDDAILIASDGVWATVTDKQAAEMIKSMREKKRTARECASHVVQVAVERFTRIVRDNASCVVLFLGRSNEIDEKKLAKKLEEKSKVSEN